MEAAELSPAQRLAQQRFMAQCQAVGFVIPDALCDIMDDPLAGRDDLSEEEKGKAAAHVLRHGCYTQLARTLRVSSTENNNQI